ncbi:MAG: hypothetical protein LIO92_00415 [Clostridiales bacterium]|nr:hypothetical protein [Clostridiales bacterium]
MVRTGTEYELVFALIDRCLEEKTEGQILVAIDGMSASGKTTLGEILKSRYNCGLFHMDDFYLRPEQRRPERYREPGGNVDRERFRDEILVHLADPQGLEYHTFDCAKMAFGDRIHEDYHRLNIIEGAYSQHPYFGDIYNLRFYYGIDPEEQKRRILARNGAEKLAIFLERWIPMENQYLDAFGIAGQSIRIGE